MGNHRFRLSDMIPDAWLHKLKLMGRATRCLPAANSVHSSTPPLGGPPTAKLPPPPPPPPFPQPRRASYYFSDRQERASAAAAGVGPGSPLHPRASDTLFPLDPPRKSKKRPRRKQPPRPSHRLVSSASPGGWTCRATLHSDAWEGEAAGELRASTEAAPAEKLQDQDRGDEDGDGAIPCFDKLVVAAGSPPSWTNRKVASPARDGDAVPDVACDGLSAAKFEELGLPPILTKPPNRLVDGGGGGRSASSKAAAKNSRKQGLFPPPPPPEEETGRRRERRPPAAAQGVRLRAAASPRTKVRAQQQRSRKAPSPRGRRRLSESFAVVKSSADPQRDFRDSMMEMIAENGIRGSRDGMEDLLACYLSLNSDEYHDVIVDVFEQIWLDLAGVRCRDHAHRRSSEGRRKKY